MSWAIVYYSERVREEVDGLPRGIRASYLRLTQFLEENGPWLPMPHARSLGGGLYELRPQAREGIGRVFYCAAIGQEIVMLHCFIKKTEKTPAHEMQTARRRLKEIKSHEI